MTAKEALYKLLRISLGNEKDLSLPNDICMPELMDLADMSGVSGLAVIGYQKLADNGFNNAPANKDEEQRLLQWLGLSMMLEQQSVLQWKVIQQLVDFFSRQDIVTVGLKGMTVAQWYPNPMLRNSCDFDCFLLKEYENGIMSSAYEEGNKIVEAKGIHVDRRIYVHSVFDYKGVTVENHHFLSAVKLSKRHRKLDALLRSLLLTEPLQPVMNSNLVTGSPMFNAVFLTHHAHRHLLNECLPLKLLTDWALFIKNNEDFDWGRFWQCADEFGMLRFAQSMTRMAIQLLGATVPFTIPEDDEADELLERCLWDFPDESNTGTSLLSRRFYLMKSIMRSRKKYKVFYDSSSVAMIIAYIRGYLFGREG